MHSHRCESSFILPSTISLEVLSKVRNESLSETGTLSDASLHRRHGGFFCIGVFRDEYRFFTEYEVDEAFGFAFISDIEHGRSEE